MDTLHIFNPEHDIALAFNLPNFTAPHAARMLRTDLGYLPALWAGEGDCVVVDNVEWAEYAWKRLRPRLAMLGACGDLTAKNVRFRAWEHGSAAGCREIEPWGWNRALVAQLRRKGSDDSLLPADHRLETIRNLSHRRTAAALLPELRMDGTVGEAFECRTADEVEALLQRYGQVVMKAPWSSSGRGLRFLDLERTPFAMQEGWFRNLTDRQGSVMVEPYYNKVKDFGMEFSADATGAIRYEGLSLFHTVNGAYTGNVIATEKAKQEMMERYIPASLMQAVRARIASVLSGVLGGRYTGPFGVDMMVVAAQDAQGFLLHPCVEINLRRTMGHVALSLSPDDDDVVKVMRIALTDHYKLKINKLQ